MATFSQATINNKYINADVNRNVSPKIHIFLRSFVPSNMLIKKTNTHIAHGLKPSTSPITAAIIGNETFFTSTFPKIGKSLILSSLSFFGSFTSFLIVVSLAVLPAKTFPTTSSQSSFKHFSILFFIINLVLSLNPTVYLSPIIVSGT